MQRIPSTSGEARWACATKDCSDRPSAEIGETPHRWRLEIPLRLIQILGPVRVEERVQRPGRRFHVGERNLHQLVARGPEVDLADLLFEDRKSTRLNSSH